jgi:CheY-like chemotaxis protein
MNDAVNLSDSNDGSSIPGNACEGSRPLDHVPAAPNAAAEMAPLGSDLADQQGANAISSAAAEVARVRDVDVGARSRDNHGTPFPDRRRRRRALISAPLRVRGVHVTESGPDEISTTIDVSRGGILFVSQNKSFVRGMDVAVTFPYSKAPDVLHAEQNGKVTRVHHLPDGQLAVAIAMGIGVGEDLVDSCGRKLDRKEACVCDTLEPGSAKPLVLAVDADEATRNSLRSYLTGEGYDVIAVKTGPEARVVLENFIPALLIAEVEGEGLPGFELCALVKCTERLRKIPVLLTTRNGCPTDYSNAHSLGAVVCMAKPYRQERLGHVVRLLAPPPQSSVQIPRASGLRDSNRRALNGNGAKSMDSNHGSRWFRFPSFHH